MLASPVGCLECAHGSVDDASCALVRSLSEIQCPELQAGDLSGSCQQTALQLAQYFDSAPGMPVQRHRQLNAAGTLLYDEIFDFDFS